jgi:RNA polymerase sigma-70 factor (ECF subfamily)
MDRLTFKASCCVQRKNWGNITANGVNTTSDSNQEPASDASLLNRLQLGEQDAATALYEKYAERLLRLADKRTGASLAARVDAEDVVQSVFRTFFRRASAGYYQLPDGEELWKLFLVISLNKIRKKASFHRAAKRSVTRTESLGQQQIEQEPHPSDVLKLTIDELMCAMPSEHRGVIRDRINGFEVTEMALRNNLTKRTVERILQSFRKRLRRELEMDE